MTARTAPRPVLSTGAAAELLGLSPKAVVALLRSGDLQGYPQRTPSGRVHAWKIYTDSIVDLQGRLEASSPLARARKGRAA